MGSIHPPNFNVFIPSPLLPAACRRAESPSDGVPNDVVGAGEPWHTTPTLFPLSLCDSPTKGNAPGQLKVRGGATGSSDPAPSCLPAF